VAITFDDGYRGVYRRAFPLLRAMSLPATVFLTTDFVGSAELPWWERLLWQTNKFFALSKEEQHAGSKKLAKKWGAILSRRSGEAVLMAYKSAGKAEREELDGIWQDLLGKPLPWKERIFLSQEEIGEMRRAGISFGVHTRSHPLLSWLDEAALKAELAQSKEAVENLTGEKGCWFSYPDGIFSNREQEAVRRAGFLGAVQTFRRPECGGRFAVPRVPLKSEDTTTKAQGCLSRAMMEFTLADCTRSRLRWRRRSAPRTDAKRQG
jgi:peptidoglycan/xylan/chitin deacetylase (PgdA/CDA1 family)